MYKILPNELKFLVNLRFPLDKRVWVLYTSNPISEQGGFVLPFLQPSVVEELSRHRIGSASFIRGEPTISLA
jgi:hypothetical protein